MARIIVEWIAYFYAYCFLGWCIESTIVSFSQKKLVNRGFLKGPFLPIYGFGAITMVASCLWLPHELNWVDIGLVYVVGMISATLLELLSGILIENIFKMKYWDYTGKFCNFKGYICLKSSLFWGVLTVALVFFIHEKVSGVVNSAEYHWLMGIVGALSAVLMMDLITSFKDAFDVQKFLVFQAKMQEELSEIKLKLATAKDESVAELEFRRDRLLEEFGLRKQRAKAGFKRLANYPTAYSKNFGKLFTKWKDIVSDIRKEN